MLIGLNSNIYLFELEIIFIFNSTRHIQKVILISDVIVIIANSIKIALRQKLPQHEV